MHMEWFHLYTILERGRQDEMVVWHHWLNGHEFEQAPGVGDGQGSLACCSSWRHKEMNMTETELNWTEKSDCYEAVTGLSKKSG